MAELNIDELAAKTVPDLIKLLASMQGQSGSVVGAEAEAHRQAIQCLIEDKLTSILASSIHTLNESTTRLSKIGIAIAIIGVIVAVVGVGVALVTLWQ